MYKKKKTSVPKFNLVCTSGLKCRLPFFLILDQLLKFGAVFTISAILIAYHYLYFEPNSLWVCFNSSQTTERTNIKLGAINYDSGMSDMKGSDVTNEDRFF